MEKSNIPNLDRRYSDIFQKGENRKRRFEIRKYPVHIYLIIFLTLLSLGLLITIFIISRGKTSGNEDFNAERRLPEKHQLISPLLDCAEESDETISANRLKNLVEKYINESKSAGKASVVAVYYRDLNNGPWFGINSSTDFTPASLLKIPLMLTYFKLAEKDPSVLQQKIKNNAADTQEMYDSMNFKAEKQLEPNADYTVEELITRMIEYSDNVAYKILLDNVDKPKLQSIYEDFGIDISKGINNTSEDILTLKDYSSFYRILYNASYLNKDLSEKVLELLSKTTFNSGLVAKLPENTVVAHKFGERHFSGTNESQLHDCGIVYTADKNYILCIMTKGTDFNNLIEVISNISSQVYTYITENK